MSLLTEVETYVLSIVPSGPLKAEIAQRLEDVFAGKNTDLEALMEWLKTRPILSPLTKGILGFVFTLTVPSERGLQRRRFVQNALNGNGDPNNMDKAVKLYRKLKREITFHGAKEIALSYSAGALASCMGLIYNRMGAVTTEVAFGLEIANSEIQDERHAKLQQAQGMARAYRELQVVPAKLTFSFEGHVERVYRRLDAPQHAPASELEW